MSKKAGKPSAHYKIKPKFKKNPDPHRFSGQQCNGEDALSPDRIADHLPSQEALYKEVSYVSEIADTASRARSGGVWQSDKDAVLPLVLPRGRKAYKDFHDKFTREKEKPKEKETLRLDANASQRRYEGPAFRVVSLPETFCSLCCKKDVKPGEGMIDFSPLAIPWEGMGLIVGDVIRKVFCYHCTKEMKRSLRTGILIRSPQGPIDSGLLKGVKRAEKIDKNVERFLRAAKMAGTEGVFPVDDD